MQTYPQTHLPEKAQEALAGLWKAFACARDLKIDPWEFSLQLLHLVDLGVDKSDLRWLVLNGYVTFRDQGGRIQPGSNVVASGDPRFMITEAGVLVVGAMGQGMPEIVPLCSQLPHWDSDRRTLYLGQQIVKRFKRPSPNQDLILLAFEEEGWPRHIYDPLPAKDEVVAKQRLHDTIVWLNRNQENRLLRFSGDGTGEGICWKRFEAGTIAISAVVPKKRRLAA